jgi:hypothetical protein
MPIGKDSIQKRVAKVETAAETVTATVTETAPAAKKPAAKKATTTKKCATTAAKKPAAKKPAAEKPVAPVVDNEPATAVLSNVAPETVAAVIGHEEGTPSDRVSIGDKMPTYLL